MFLIVGFVLFGPFNLSAQKTDTLVHINGNVLTGEIKKMVDGILYFKMDGMGTVSVEAEKIRTMQTQKILQIRTSDKKLILGSFDESDDYGYVYVGYGVNKKKIRVLDIIEIFPIKSTFWLRTSGNFDFGFDYTKSTNMTRLNSSGRIDYRKQKIYSALYWNSYVTLQEITEDSSALNDKMDFNYDYKGYMNRSWLLVGRIGLNSNKAMGLSARVFFGAGFQKDIVYTTRSHLYWQLGGNFNREFAESGNITTNQELALSLGYDIFKHSSPKVTLTSNIGMYPNLKFNGRWRLDTDLYLNLEVFHNFYVGFKVYSNYDSMPVDENAANNDWGTAFTIGYSFH